MIAGTYRLEHLDSPKYNVTCHLTSIIRQVMPVHQFALHVERGLGDMRGLDSTVYQLPVRDSKSQALTLKVAWSNQPEPILLFLEDCRWMCSLQLP